MISFTDLLQGEILAEFSAISANGMLTAIGLSFLLSLFIVFIYRITFSGVSFSFNFACCLLMIAMVTAVVIQVISSNVVLSLGMVGALSIVRFRTAVKEPADTAFLFWAIATGIICGAGYVTISVLATLLLGLLFVAIYAFTKKGRSHSYMVVVRCTPDSRAELTLSKLPAYRLKNKAFTATATEIVAEVRLSENDMKKLEALRSDPEVMEISIMSSVNGTAL